MPRWTAVGSALLCIAFSLARPAGAAGPSCPWTEPGRSPAARTEQLLAAMSLGDKIQMVTGQYAGPNASSTDPLPVGTAGYIEANPKLCIPALLLNDAGNGIGDEQSLTTAFPDHIALAASWDPDLALDYGQTLGREAFTKGVNVVLGPGMDIARNPLNGRNFEYAGEDPYLAGRMVAELIPGIQSNHVIATAKHYALNDQEQLDAVSSSDASERTMQEIHLPQFRAAVKAGVGAVMCSYNRINSVYACQNPFTLRRVLRHQFGFSGWVMSDWGATHATVASTRAGLDMELPSGTYYGQALQTAVQAGKVPMATLNQMVRRILLTMFRVGLFDHRPVGGAQALASVAMTPDSLATATRIAEAGSVLLKNQHHVLPLAAPGKRIALIGPAASPHGAELCSQGGGSGHVPLFAYQPGVVAPVQAIQARAAQAGDVVSYADGTSTQDAVQLAKQSDYAVVLVCDAEIEGSDRPSMNAQFGSCLFAAEIVAQAVVDPAASGCAYSPIDQNALVSAVAAVNPHTIVVVQAGSPVAMPWVDRVAGILDNWYPGQTDGQTLAPLLFGDVSPSGHLPMTFPRRLGDGPLRSASQYPGVTVRGDKLGPHSTYSEGLLVGYRWYDAKGVRPLFPFGYGLSYTTFRFTGLHLSQGSDGACTVTFRVTNTGSRPGAEVTQLYVGQPASTGEPPRQLKGFQKVWLAPGETRTVSITLGPEAFAHWDVRGHTWAVTPGTYGLYVGDSSAVGGLPLHTRIDRKAETLSPGAY